MTELAIDQIVQFGRAFDLRQSMSTTDIQAAIRALFRELAAQRVDYVLVGGVALLNYVRGRNTQDIDLIVSPADLPRLPWSATVQDQDFGRATFAGIRVDLLLTTNALFEHVRANERTTVRFAELDVPCATRDGLLLLKLYALPSVYRRGDLARAALYETDVLMLHQGVEVDDDALLALLTKHLAQHDVQELRRILVEQRTRTRFQR